MDKISLILIAASACTNAAGSTIMKYAYGGNDLLSGGIISAFLKILLNPWIVLGLSMFGISFFFMAAALSRSELTFAYPMMSAIVYLILLAIGYFVFHENITLYRLGGMAFILAGIVLLAK